jgi:1-acyl-sn-glycerol-3-phosphate acyltransferase
VVAQERTPAEPRKPSPGTDDDAPDLVRAAEGQLGRLEQWNLRAVRRTLASPGLDRVMRLGQRSVGQMWVDRCTRALREHHGLDRVGPVHELGNFILATNHRSYFDLYVVSMILYTQGLRRRFLCPVRSGFFYDHPLGLAVNGVMSFFSMYPPIFRDRKRATLNRVGLDELALFLEQHDVTVGIHPEGTRNKGEDPYALLPAQGGVGRLIHRVKTPVVPAFINGLGNDLPRQVRSNFDGSGERLIVVYGAPIDYGALLDAPPSARLFRQISQHTLDVIAGLGEEERALRAGTIERLGPQRPPPAPPPIAARRRRGEADEDDQNA